MRLCLLTLLLLVPVVAHAEANAPVDQATLDEAERIFFEGLAHYRASRFEKAAVAFQKAYSLTRHRDLLFNVARSRERLGDKAGAVQWYRSYLGTEPADETAIIHRIKQLGGDPTAVAQPDLPKTDIVKRPVETGSVQEGPSAWPWLLVGTGALAAGAGAYFGLVALDEADSARAARDRTKAEQHKSDAESNALIADVAFGVGALAIGTAVVLWLQDDTPTRRGAVQVGAAPTADGWQIGIGGAF
jgi:tetratricopeptide (TPR) repeat protein